MTGSDALAQRSLNWGNNSAVPSGTLLWELPLCVPSYRVGGYLPRLVAGKSFVEETFSFPFEGLGLIASRPLDFW